MYLLLIVAFRFWSAVCPLIQVHTCVVYMSNTNKYQSLTPNVPVHVNTLRVRVHWFWVYDLCTFTVLLFACSFFPQLILQNYYLIWDTRFNTIVILKIWTEFDVFETCPLYILVH